MGEPLIHRRQPGGRVVTAKEVSLPKRPLQAAAGVGSIPSFVALRPTTLSPDMARELLRRAHPSRRRQEDIVRSYAQAMRDGFWVMNGMPIILSQGGVLLDGMQRLAACVETGIPLHSFLAEHVADEAFHTIDQHRRRTFAAMLKQQRHRNHHLLASLLARLADYDHRVLGGPPVSPAAWVRLDRILARQPGIEAALAASLARPASPLPEPVRSMIVFMGQQVAPALTTRLLEVLEAPEQYPADEPAVLLCQELQRPRGTASPEKTLALAIKTLNAMLHGEKPRGLAWSDRAVGRKPAEAFPRLHGYGGLAGLGLATADAAAERGRHWQMEIIDAATAARYLATGTPRQAIPAHVQALASDIQRGRWLLNAQPICFAADGQLINGMHRLLAVVASGGTIRVPVVRGLPLEARATYDTQAKRIAAAESLAGDFGDQGLATAMANLLWRHERRTDKTRYKRAGAAEIREILTQHPRLIELRGFARRMVEYGRSSIIGYGAYVMEREDAAAAAAFLKALSSGADLPQGHPVLTLRSTLQRLRRDNATQDEQLATLLAGWRRYRLHSAQQDDRRQGPAVAPARTTPGRAS
jgi:hypothetical protein